MDLPPNGHELLLRASEARLRGDREERFVFLAQALLSGYTPAYGAMAELFHDEGLEEWAAQYFMRGIAAGHGELLVPMAELNLEMGDRDSAKFFYSWAARLGNVHAMVLLGKMEKDANKPMTAAWWFCQGIIQVHRILGSENTL